MGIRRTIIYLAVVLSIGIATVVGAAKVRIIFTNFTAGELSPILGARVDFRKYSNGADTLENMVVYPHGPVTKRPGFRYVADTKYPGYPVRLIPFTASTEDSYMVEIGDEYMRFYKDNGQITESGTTDYTANPGLLGSGTTGFWTGWSASLGNSSAGVTVSGISGTTSYVAETVTAGMLSSDGGEWIPANLLDGNINTYGFSQATWVQIDFGQGNEKALGKWSFYSWNNSRIYKVQSSSDGSTWADAATGLDVGSIGWVSVTWTPSANYRYWRVLATSGDGSGSYIAELLVYSSPVITHYSGVTWTALSSKEGVMMQARNLKPATEYTYAYYYRAGVTEVGSGFYFSISDLNQGNYSENIIGNTSFETDVNGWHSVKSATIEKVSTYYQDGLSSAKVLFSSTSGSGVSTTMAVISTVTGYAHPYNLKMYVLPPEGMQKIHLKVTDHDSGATPYWDENIDGLNAGEWNLVERQIVVWSADWHIPPEAGWVKTLNLEILKHPKSATGDYVYIDNITGVTITNVFSGFTGPDYESNRFQNPTHEEWITPTDIWINKTGTVRTGVTSTSLGILFGSGDAALGSDTSLYIASLSLSETDQPYEIYSPYTGDSISKIQYTQSADVMILTHPEYPIYQLSRTSTVPVFTMSAYAITGVAATFSPLNTGVSNYPASCLFHENRLIFARTIDNPIDVWCSQDGDFPDFTTAGLATDAINISLASDEINQIQWLRSMDSVMIGTTMGEWKLGAIDSNDPLTPDNIMAKRQTMIGCAEIRPYTVASTTLFAQYYRAKIYKLAYNWESAAYIAPELSVLAQHVTKPKIFDMAFQRQPHAILWIARDDGVLAGMTFHDEHEVVAWHRHPSDYGSVKYLGVIPGDVEDQLWACWERYAYVGSGVTQVRRSIEYLESFYDSTNLSTAYFLDGQITTDIESGSLSGVSAPYLASMAGRSVKVLIDGTTVESATVGLDGSLAISQPATSTITVGFPYTAKLKTMRPEIQTQRGSIQGRPKTYTDAGLRLYQSWGGTIGESFSQMRDIAYKAPGSAAPLTSPVAYTGDLHPFALWGGVNRDGYVCIQHEDPWPFTLLGVMVDMEVE